MDAIQGYGSDSEDDEGGKAEGGQVEEVIVVSDKPLGPPAEKKQKTLNLFGGFTKNVVVGGGKPVEEGQSQRMASALSGIADSQASAAKSVRGGGGTAAVPSR